MFDGLTVKVAPGGEEEATPKLSNTKIVDMEGAPRMDDPPSPAATDETEAPTFNGGDDNTRATATSPEGTPRGGGMQIHPDTPIPNADKGLRILRKFASKTRPKIATEYGGTKSAGFMRFFRSSSSGVKDDPTFAPYRKLMDFLLDGDESEDEEDTETDDEDPKEATGDESDFVIDTILGASGDDMAKARASVAAFCHVLSIWGHASSRFFEQQDTKSQQAFSELLVTGIDSAAELVAHGCLDGVAICNLASTTDEYLPIINLLAESILVADVTLERSELAAMKFLLSAGCRVKPGEDALLRGTHLLQTIRILYHIYLTTDSEANRTTARAALQQLVTSIFARLVRTQVALSAMGSPMCVPPSPALDNHLTENGGASIFPSENHRDAFLVLRSICKLSMRNMPSDDMHSHVGLQTSGSNAMWDGERDGAESNESSISMSSEAARPKEQPHLVGTSAIHPAMESKVLALELLHYVLENVKFTREFVVQSGPQFHSAIRNYLCVSLLKNCTSDNSRVVHLSLRMFALLVRNFRTILKNEVEAFVTNVFFVILDSKNSPIEHKSLVVTLFEEICSDPNTLAEIFLNYDCDLSAVDLFHRIVNTLSRVARSDSEKPQAGNTIGFVAGAGAARAEKMRNEHRELRLDAMRALRQVLASLHASIVEPMNNGRRSGAGKSLADEISSTGSVGGDSIESGPGTPARETGKQNLVQIYDSKKKRRKEESEAVLRFNQKPSAGIKYAAECGHINGDDPADIARYLLVNKDNFEKTQIGEFLGREAEYQGGMALKVLHEYVRMMDLAGLPFDDAIRYYLSGFRLPGEAQKIDRIMEKFAERYTEQNPDVFPTADVAFILAFSIIMLNTDLHNPAIKEERRMTRVGFIRNNRGIADGQDLPDELILGIFDRIKTNPISLKEDDDAREKVGDPSKKGSVGSLPSALSPAIFFNSHYDDMDRTRETNFQKEKDHIVRTTESLLKRRRHSTHQPGEKRNTPGGRTGSNGKRSQSKFVRTEDSGLRDEYVSPMFEVTWGPALAAFSTAMESANGTVGALENIATDEELELAAENAAETIEVCLTGFKFAIGTAGLCGNEIARDSYMLALSRFSQLGTGALLEPRHLRCVQTVLSLGREDGELLGSAWEHVFKALAEVNRFHQLFQLMARNDRTAAAAADRRRKRLEERAERHRRNDSRSDDSLDDSTHSGDQWSTSGGSLAEEELFSDDEDFAFEDEMDGKAIDEANARVVYEAVSESMIEAIYERSSSLSKIGVKEFIFQLCRVSRMEISVGGYGGHVGSNANTVDLTKVQYRQRHSLLNNSSMHGDEAFHHRQPNIYSLQKLVEVTHYNMDSRPRLVFSEIWTTVSGHLTSTALHSNPAVAMYAVDSFRQLSIQFLQRGETEGFEVQRKFLKPLETVISRSVHVSTKELLLKCVERIVYMFGCDDVESEVGGRRKGSLRSGWVTILKILAMTGEDADEGIAKMGYEMLREQLKLSLEIERKASKSDEPQSSSILVEHFVDAIDALFAYVGGAHEESSLAAIDQLMELCKYLGDEKMPLPPLRRKSSHLSAGEVESNGEANSAGSDKDFEHWWPILLGLSKSVGHPSLVVRSKTLSSLLEITEHHFLNKSKVPADERKQTLRLIYRGILTPALESAETSPTTKPPPLPEDFERLITKSDNGAEQAAEASGGGWLETTFEEFMDGCIALCLKSIAEFNDDTLVEEIFAILNNCLLSDSGALAVRGLKRLERFVADELDPKYVTDDTWATVSHMLRRCLQVRGLPKAKDKPTNGDDGSSELRPDAEDEDDIREFVIEDGLLPDRRYVGANAVMIIGSFLTNERFHDAITLNWRLFLVSGLGRSVKEWELAASVISSYTSKDESAQANPSPPDYLETAIYGRKCMMRMIVALASMDSIALTPSSSDTEATTRVAEAQKVVREQTQKFLAACIAKETAASQKGYSQDDVVLYEASRKLVLDFLSSFDQMDTNHLHNLEWLNPVLLSWCTRSKYEPIQKAVHDLLEKTSPASPSNGSGPEA